MLIDISLLSYAIYHLNGSGSPLIFCYLFMIFGYGFRYGNRYLLCCVAMSLTGFSLIIAGNQYWQTQYLLGYGFLVFIILLSLYVSTLISQLHTAISAANTANEAKSQFLANMSHEIRTPLNGVIGMSSLLAETKLEAKQKDYAATINASAKTLLTLINDILDISKIEAGKVSIESENFDLHSLMNSTAKILAPHAEVKKLDFNIHISPEIPYLLIGDEQLLRQIIINLLSNAIKFTDEGAIEIFLHHLSSIDNKEKIRFEIIDTGIGIPDEAKAKLFSKFTQADSSTTRKYGGTGLGMAIAKQLVEAMDGTIGFESELNVGTSFWFELDFEKQATLSEEKESLAKIINSKIYFVGPSSSHDSIFNTHLSTWNLDFYYISSANDALK
ncbi:MAG: ATP-binding protein, partial [Pseudomonadota bacterium]